MLKKSLIFIFVVSCSTAIFAQDYSTDWKAAYKLYRARKYAEAVTAFVKLAEQDYTSQSGKYNCYIHAGYSARNLKKYDEAVAFATKASKVKNHYFYEGKTREFDFMVSGKKYKELTETITTDEILEWPKYYRSNALYYLGLAQYYLKNAEDAEKTFKLMHENAVRGYYKTLALLRSGNNYRHRMKDKERAAATYKAAIAVPKGHPHHKAEACEQLVYILISQKKNDEALAEYDKSLKLKLNGYWKSRMMYRKADLLRKMGKKEEAVKFYNQAIATKGCPGWVKKGCQKGIKALEAK